MYIVCSTSVYNTYEHTKKRPISICLQFSRVYMFNMSEYMYLSVCLPVWVY